MVTNYDAELEAKLCSSVRQDGAEFVATLWRDHKTIRDIELMLNCEHYGVTFGGDYSSQKAIAF